jgi:hypothetical protein
VTRSAPRLTLAGLMLLAAAWLSLWLPLPEPATLPALLAGLAVWGAACARWPRLWLFALPTLLAVVDTAPWTGWFLFDLPDVMLLVALAVELGRRASFRPLPVGGLALFAVAAFLLSMVLSLLVGTGADLSVLTRMPGPNDLYDYLSPWNGPRVALGVLWAVALLPVLARLTREDPGAPAVLAAGLALALVLVGIAAIRERWLYTDFLDFTREYRVVATFASMRVGGSHIGAFIVLALPAALALILLERRWLTLLLGVAALTAGLGALFLTYTRAAWLGGAVGLGTATLSVLFHGSGRERPASRWQPALTAVAGLVALATFAAAITLSGYARQRLAATPEDFGSRLAIYADALAMMDPGPTAQLFGMGLGSFPAVYYTRNPDGVSPSRRLIDEEGGNRFMRLLVGVGGRYPEELLFAIYQRLPLRPQESWTLTLRARSPNAGRLTVEIKEKPTLYGGHGIEVGQARQIGPDWQEYRFTFDSGRLGAGQLFTRRAATLLLRAAPEQGVVDVDDVRLLDRTGHDIMRNGDFSAGHEDWTFEAPHHVAYQVKNAFIGIYFDQGAVGLAAFLMLLVAAAAAYPEARQMRPGPAAGLAGGIAGFLLSGMFDNPFTEPRIILLFMIVLFQLLVMRPMRARERHLPGGEPKVVRH